MVAADRLTIRITAMDSLNSCCRLGQTTNFSSSTVSAKNPPERCDSASALELSVVVSSEIGLVTEMGPIVDNGAGRHFAKQIAYRTPSNPHGFKHQGISVWIPQTDMDSARTAEPFLQELCGQGVFQLTAQHSPQRPSPAVQLPHPRRGLPEFGRGPKH